MKFTQRAFLIFSLLASPHPSWAQMEMSLDRQGKPDYITIVDRFSLSEIRQGMLNAWKHGLNPKIYWTEQMESLYQRNGEADRNLKALANQALILMFRNLSLGSVDPQTVGRDVKLVRKSFLTPQQLQVLALASGGSLDNLVDNVAPRNAPYLAVKEALVKIYPSCQSGEWQEITPAKIPLRLYSHDKSIVDIKKRLSLLGYKFTNMDDAFDGDLQSAVSDIQWNLRFQPDGTISPKGKVWSFLNVSCIERVHQLQIDMEKMRWFPQNFERRYIFVNLAMSYFVLMDQTYDWNRVMSFRTVNGRVARKSPTMQDQVVKVIINPFWVVPPTIFSEDKVNDLKDLTKEQITQYFDIHHYEVWTSDFKQRVDPTSIDWKGISEGRGTPDIQIRQLPHLGNALGVLKFDLTNSFLIYLHDTNQRELFNVPMRQLSSGCIRLEKPLDLAEFLLEDTPWDRKSIEALMARPGEVLTKSTELPVPKSKVTPVYTVYLTSQMSSDGVIRFVDDLYGQNAQIKRSLTGLL